VIPASVAVAPRRSSHAAIIGRAAVRALYTELALSPKPGLVSPLDSGAHDDMDMTTFMRSLFALRGYFCAIAAAGAAGADFTDPYHGSVWWRVGWACDSRLRDERSALNGWD
jgi:triphosphoribosyl-dephospho-CoA synthase